MEMVGLLWIPDFLVWLLLFAVALYVYGTWPYKSLAVYGYKGPKPKPFIGNFFLVFKSDHVGSWDLTGKKLYGKVFAMYEGRQPTIVVFDTDVLKHVLVKDFANFRDRRKIFLRGRVLRRSLLELEGDEWRRTRGLVSPFFTTGKLKRNIQVLDVCLKHLEARCKTFVEQEVEFDVKEVTGAFTLEAICLTAFGLVIDSQTDPSHPLLETTKKMLDIKINRWPIWVAFAFPFLAPYLDRLGIDLWPAGSVETICRLTRDAIEDRRKSQSEQPDFIQAMIKALEAEQELKAESSTETTARGKALNETEIAAQVMVFILAGYDTVSTTLSFLLFNLANNQTCQDRVSEEINNVIGDSEMTYDNLKDMTYLDMCLEESQRLYPSVFRTNRRCLQDTTVNGYFIPKGTLVIIPIYGLHHDPEIWTNPEEFDPERFNSENRRNIDAYAFQGFGSGPRNCVGMRLAQIEVKMAVIHILRNYKITVGNKTRLPVQLDNWLFPRAKGGLWLKLTKRFE